MTHGSLFSGIGGFDLAAEMMGWENLFHCEWNPFGQKVLHHYWPNAEQFTDITKSDFTKYANRIDILTGGFPCQPYSLAGKRKGKDDERHLWPEMLRAIREIQPRWVVGENVFGLVNWNGGLVFHEVQADLEAEGYEVQPFILPACSVNAPHRRDRVWFVAYRNTQQRERQTRRFQSEPFDGSKQYATNPCNKRLQRGKRFGENESTNSGWKKSASRTTSQFHSGSNWKNFPTQSPICGGDDGLPTELDGITFSKWRNESIKAYGNAIVPQVSLQIFKAIEQYELL